MYLYVLSGYLNSLYGRTSPSQLSPDYSAATFLSGPEASVKFQGSELLVNNGRDIFQLTGSPNDENCLEAADAKNKFVLIPHYLLTNQTT